MPIPRGKELKEAISIELLELISERIPPSATNPRPPTNSAIPPIIIKIAMIVIPTGLFVFVFEFKFVSK